LRAVPTAYLDTSALGRVLLKERETASIQRELANFGQHISSRLMRVELCRLGTREGVLDLADAMLGPILLIPLDEEILTRAEVLPPTSVGTLDAIHLSTALRVAEAGELDALMTYDKRLAEGARKHGITVLSPV